MKKGYWISLYFQVNNQDNLKKIKVILNNQKEKNIFLMKNSMLTKMY